MSGPPWPNRNEPDREGAGRPAQVDRALGRDDLERALRQRLREAADLRGEIALGREPGLTQPALPELQLAVGVGIVKDQEEDVDVRAVEQARPDLRLVDLAGVGDADQVEIVDREGEVVADRGAIEPGRGQNVRPGSSTPSCGTRCDHRAFPTMRSLPRPTRSPILSGLASLSDQIDCAGPPAGDRLCEGFRMPAGREVAGRAAGRRPKASREDAMEALSLVIAVTNAAPVITPAEHPPCPGRTTSADPFRPLISSARWLS